MDMINRLNKFIAGSAKRKKLVQDLIISGLLIFPAENSDYHLFLRKKDEIGTDFVILCLGDYGVGALKYLDETVYYNDITAIPNLFQLIRPWFDILNNYYAEYMDNQFNGYIPYRLHAQGNIYACVTIINKCYIWTFSEDGEEILLLSDYNIDKVYLERHRFAVKKLNNTVVIYAVEGYSTVVKVGEIKDIKELALGREHYIYIDTNNKCYAHGANIRGQLGTIDNQITYPYPPNITSISATGYRSGCVTNTDEIFMWGANSRGQLGVGDFSDRNKPAILDIYGESVYKLFMSEITSAFINNSNKVFVWGENGKGQLGLKDVDRQTTPTDVEIPYEQIVYVSLNRNYSLFLTKLGNCYTTLTGELKLLEPLKAYPVRYAICGDDYILFSPRDGNYYKYRIATSEIQTLKYCGDIEILLTD